MDDDIGRNLLKKEGEKSKGSLHVPP